MNITESGMKFMLCIMLCVAAAMVTMTGCASSSSNRSNVYTYEQTMQAQTVDTGTVESVKSIIIQAANPPVAGAAIGGMTGGMVGSLIGGGHGRDVAVIVGALTGAAIGAAIEHEAGTQNGLEIVVNLDSGITIVVIQEANVPMSPGDRVWVLTTPDGTTRISK